MQGSDSEANTVATSPCTRASPAPRPVPGTCGQTVSDLSLVNLGQKEAEAEIPPSIVWNSKTRDICKVVS